MDLFLIVVTGFVSGIALFAAVGAQTLFIIRHGASGKPMWPITVAAIVSDMLLVGIGVAGVGKLVTAFPPLVTVMTLVGVAFLALYGSAAIIRVFRTRTRRRQVVEVGEREPAAVTGAVPAVGVASVGAEVVSTSQLTAVLEREPADEPQPEVREHRLHESAGFRDRHVMLTAVLTLLAFTWLNPQAYLDVAVILGSMSAGYGDPGRWFFAAGVMGASMTWFVLLGVAAKAMGRLFERYPKAWVVMDIVTGVLMFVLAAVLATHML